MARRSVMDGGVESSDGGREAGKRRKEGRTDERSQHGSWIDYSSWCCLHIPAEILGSVRVRVRVLWLSPACPLSLALQDNQTRFDAGVGFKVNEKTDLFLIFILFLFFFCGYVFYVEYYFLVISFFAYSYVVGVFHYMVYFFFFFLYVYGYASSTVSISLSF